MAKKFEWTPKNIRELQRLAYETNVDSLDRTVKVDLEEADDLTVGSNVPDPIDYENLIFNNFRRKELITYLEELDPRDYIVICYRFGFIDNDFHSLDSIAKMYGITRERIRQIENRALHKLRKILLKHGIESNKDL